MLDKPISTTDVMALIAEQKTIGDARGINLTFATGYNPTGYKQVLHFQMTTDLFEESIVDTFGKMVAPVIEANKFSRLFELSPKNKSANIMNAHRRWSASLAHELGYKCAEIHIERKRTGKNETRFFFWMDIPGMVELLDFQTTYAIMSQPEIEKHLREVSYARVLERSGIRTV